MRYQSRLASVLSLLLVLVDAQTPAYLGPLFIEPSLDKRLTFTGKCFTAASNSDGAIVTIQTCTGSTAQDMDFHRRAASKSFGNTKCLDVTNGFDGQREQAAKLDVLDE
ncbi:hypothetical protein B0H16DRAFT_1298244 [Mycena metata]|uniref:Ricin B lectin domain-containing protein n=1 Tax=Mycena metata TaxID=1033252 RepID=A0AAD7KC26_9AGAR|nr:hypothetical protein B0H16DRAFT_1298244 [Mycena metata]